MAERNKSAVEQDPRITAYIGTYCPADAGPGGWCIRLYSGEHQKEISGGNFHATSQRLALQALIDCLKAPKKRSDVSVYLRNKDIINGIDNRWAVGWQKNGWCLERSGPIPNSDLWEELLGLEKKHTLFLHWVKESNATKAFLEVEAEAKNQYVLHSDPKNADWSKK